MVRRPKRLRLLLVVLGLAIALISAAVGLAYPAGSIVQRQLSEPEMLKMIETALRDHVTYSESIYHTSATVPGAGYFGTGNSGEHGVRTNADYALMYAFLYARFKDSPEIVMSGNPISWVTIRDRAIAACQYGFSTHVSGSARCNDGASWGEQWESSLWTQALGMAAWLIWSELNPETRAGVEAMVVSEADYNAARTPPYQEWDDTKAEENGWDTNILALARSMFPSHANAEVWDRKMKSFAMNTFSIGTDQEDNTMVDGNPVSAWVLGANLHPDFTLENHGFFHPVYQMVPIQELTESAIFYTKAGLPVPEALKHNVMNVWNQVLQKNLLGDGEWAYPNGIDWSIYDYEHLEAYSALATFYQDVTAKFLESRLVQYMRARQMTTPDCSFMLNPDVGERRQGVLAHRLVYAYLMHDYYGPVPATDTTWRRIEKAHSAAGFFPYNRVIRGLNSHNFAAFSWDNKIMGIVNPNSEKYLDDPYLLFPFKTENTGSFTGYMDVAGKKRNASYQRSTYVMRDDGFVTAGYLTEDDNSLDHYLAFAKTLGNAVVYLDEIKARVDCTVNQEGGLALGIISDVVGGDPRTLHYNGGSIASNGDAMLSITGNWVNVDYRLGLVVSGGAGIKFGERVLTNSVYVPKLYGSYSATPRNFTAGQVVSSKTGIVYSNIDSVTTGRLANEACYPKVAPGWKGVVVTDPDYRRFLVISNFYGAATTGISLSYPEGAPVLERDTTITGLTGSATLDGKVGSAGLQELGIYVTAGSGSVIAVQGDTPDQAYIKNPGVAAVNVTVKMRGEGFDVTAARSIEAAGTYLFKWTGDGVTICPAAYPGVSVNQALTGSLTATSSQVNYPPTNANDGSKDTFWVSNVAPGNVNQYLTCDLGRSFHIGKVQVFSRANYGPKDLVVEISMDGQTYLEVAAEYLPNAEGPHLLQFSEREARYVRLKLYSSYDTRSPARNVQIKEFQVFGWSDADPENETAIMK